MIWWNLILRALGMTLVLTAGSVAQEHTISSPPPEAVELARKAIANEVQAAKDDEAHFQFRSTKTNAKGGSVTKVFVETNEATAGLVVAYDGKPLTPEQRQAEEARVERFIKNPDELRKKQKQEQDAAERTMRIVRAIPDAFLFEYDGTEMGRPGIGKPGDPLVRLKFRPNPQYEPPSRVEQVLTGMQGIVLIDAVRHRLASIDGRLFQDVGFGWGILGHLDKGGHFLVQQQEIDPQHWSISRMDLEFTGKILLIKNLSIKTTEVFSGFKPVPPDLTFAQAIELLKKEEAVVAENGSSAKARVEKKESRATPSLPVASLPEP
jgi:hypothetical protein